MSPNVARTWNWSTIMKLLPLFCVRQYLLSFISLGITFLSGGNCWPLSLPEKQGHRRLLNAEPCAKCWALCVLSFAFLCIAFSSGCFIWDCWCGSSGTCHRGQNSSELDLLCARHKSWFLQTHFSVGFRNTKSRACRRSKKSIAYAA